MTQQVPLVDLLAQYQTIQPAIDAAIHAVIERSAFIMGADVRGFEAEFARFCTATHAIGVASGTAALELTLRACGIGAGDEVITSAHTFIATAEAISAVGARPVFADIDPAPTTCPRRPLPRRYYASHARHPARAHLRPACRYGCLSGALPQTHDLSVIEDAAQAHGATWTGQTVGSAGRRRLLQLLSGQEPRRLR